MLMPELSQSWAARLTKQIPEIVDVFCLACVDGTSGRYTCWGYYESTAETADAWRKRFPGCEVEIVAASHMIVPERTEAGLKFALSACVAELDAQVLKSQDPVAIRFRNKLAEDDSLRRLSGKTHGIQIVRGDA